MFRPIYLVYDWATTSASIKHYKGRSNCFETKVISRSKPVIIKNEKHIFQQGGKMRKNPLSAVFKSNFNIT